MRALSMIVAGVILAAGLAGWATLGQAQPSSKGTPVKLPALDPLEVPDVPVPKTGSPKPAAAGEIKPTVFIPAAPEETPAKSGPAAKQEPSVALEWHGAAAVAVGQPAEYALVARNTSGIPLHKVIVQVKVPAGVKLSATEPKAEGTDSVLMWDLGTLAPKDEKRMKLTFVPPEKGEVMCQAWVTFTGSTALKVAVREPKVKLTAKLPEKLSVGESSTLVFTLVNVGDHPADGMVLSMTLPAGLESKAQVSTIPLGDLAAGDEREIKIPVKATKPGAITFPVVAAGPGGLKATMDAAIAVVQPKLAIEVTGPKMRYLDRKATYGVKVTNAGDAAATDVFVSHRVPTGFKFVSADGGGKYDPESRTIAWPIGALPAGGAKDVKCELVAVTAGDFTHQFAAGGRGLLTEGTLPTKVEGLAALAMDLVDTVDPVEVGGETSYTITVSNTGSKDETDVKLVCTLPPQMKLKSARGPGECETVGQDVTFETVKSLPAGTQATFKLTVTTTDKGDARFKATLTAGGLSEPVIKQESTRVYAD